LRRAKPVLRYTSFSEPSSRASAKARMAPASDSTLCTKPRTFGICFVTPFSRRVRTSLPGTISRRSRSVGPLRSSWSSAIAVFAGSLTGALIVKTTVSPSGTALANAALSPSTSREATLSNRRRSFAAPRRAMISRSTVSASIGGDTATIGACLSQSGLRAISHRRRNGSPRFAGCPPLAISAALTGARDRRS
jgi:hypothetical protein